MILLIMKGQISQLTPILGGADLISEGTSGTKFFARALIARNFILQPPLPKILATPL